MRAAYIIWLLIFLVAPISVLWLFFYKHLWKYRSVFLSLAICAMIAGTAWDAFAIHFQLWTWPRSCCVLPRVKGFPLEELLFMVLVSIYVATVTIIMRDILATHFKLKKRGRR